MFLYVLRTIFSKMPRNILLTGFPRSGKTTLLEQVVRGISKKKGFLTREVKECGERTGFEVVSSDNQVLLLASIHLNTRYESPRYHLNTSPEISRYCADIEGFDKFVSSQFKYSKEHSLYLDEIGQMQLFSSHFRDLVTNYLDASNLFLATISKVYSDAFTESIKRRSDVILVEVDSSDRDTAYREITQLIGGV